MLLSIVIPVRRDAEALSRLLAQLPPQPDVQVIVTATSDGDETFPENTNALSAIEAARSDVIWSTGTGGPRRAVE